MEFKEIPVESIKVGEYNLRGTIDAGVPGIKALAESIGREGLLHPLVVVDEDDSTCLLVVGHRRLCAIQHYLADRMPAVPARIIPKSEADHIKATRMAVAENALRRNLNPIALAKKLAELRTAGLSNQEIADDFLGFKRAGSVTACVQLLELEPQVRDALTEGTLSFGHAKALLPLKGEADKQLRALKEILALPEGERSVRRAEAIVGHVQNGGWFRIELELPAAAKLEESKQGYRLIVKFGNVGEMRSALADILERNVDPPVRYVSGDETLEANGLAN